MEGEGRFDARAVGKGTVYGLVGALMLTLFATAVLSAVSTPAAYLGVAAAIVAWLSVATAGYIAARTAGRAALLHGALAGALFLMASLLLGALVFDQPIAWAGMALRLFVSLAVGALAGVIAIGR